MSSSARIDELRRKFDENPRRYFAPLANEYRKAGDFDQAIFICQEYLPQQPGHMSGHIVFGQALFEAKRLPEARTVFETALTLDPENLIALRHLADISRDLGEFGPARTWYERVLQADPRNEEIAAIMASMVPSAAPTGSSPIAPTEETPALSVPEVVPPPAAPAAAAAAPTMELSAAAVQEMVRARQAAQSAKAQPEAVPELISLDDASTVEISSVAPPVALEGFESTRSEETLDIPTSGGMLGFEPTAAQDSSPSPTPSSQAISDTLTLDDFSVPTTPAAPAAVCPPSLDADGMMDLGSFGFSEPAAATTPTASDISPPDLSIDAGPASAMDFELEIPDVPSAPPATPTMDSIDTVVMDIPEIMVPTPAPMPEPVSQIEDGFTLPGDSGATTPTVIIPAVRASQGAAEPPDAPPEPELVQPAPQLEVAAVMEPVAPSHPAAEAEAAAPGVPAPAPFVTETMAQLYLEQGHRADALDIYRQLVAARPDDMALRARLNAVEHALQVPPARQEVVAAEAPHKAEVPAEPPLSSRFASGGPTIRDVLRGLFGIDVQSGNGDGGLHGQPGAEVGSIDILFSAEALVDAPSSLAVAFDGGYVAAAGTIDAVFAGGA